MGLGKVMWLRVYVVYDKELIIFLVWVIKEKYLLGLVNMLLMILRNVKEDINFFFCIVKNFGMKIF